MIWNPATEQRNSDPPERQNQCPQEQRTLMRAPYRAHPEVPGQIEIRIICDVFDAEVVRQKAVHQNAKRHGKRQPL